ncbi:MAG: hypothetical protein OXC40_02860, partial [Proteobacteria bacterium]|nr:hypothetical protein [Pseudomonadota bacterium]
LSRIFTAQELYYSQHDCYAEDAGAANAATCQDGDISGKITLVAKLAIKISPSVKYFYGKGAGDPNNTGTQTSVGGVAPATQSKTMTNATTFKVVAIAKRNKLAGCSTNPVDTWCLDSSGFISNKDAPAASTTKATCDPGDVVDGGCG